MPSIQIAYPTYPLDSPNQHFVEELVFNSPTTLLNMDLDNELAAHLELNKGIYMRGQVIQRQYLTYTILEYTCLYLSSL